MGTPCGRGAAPDSACRTASCSRSDQSVPARSVRARRRAIARRRSPRPPSSGAVASEGEHITLTPEQVAPHLHRFLAMLDTAFRRYGSPDGLPDRFREAVRATPRHLFVHRFRIGGGPLRARADEGALRTTTPTRRRSWPTSTAMP